MQKLITVVRRPAGSERAAFQKRYLREDAPGFLASHPGVVRCTVNVVDVAPATEPPGEPAYDVTVETWTEAERETPVDPAFIAGLAAGGTAHGFKVSERIQKAKPEQPGLGHVPGVKGMYLVRRLEGLSNAEGKARWTAHADTARDHHAGMSQYVQNGVIESLSEGAPVVHGIAVLHFPTLEDLEQRLYDDEEGRKAIQADVANLVGGSIRLFTTEYILR